MKITKTVSIMKTTGPSIFNSETKDKILMVQRSILGLEDTTEFMIRMVMLAPCDGPEKYWSFGLTKKELTDMHKEGKLLTSTDYEFLPDPSDAADIDQLNKGEQT